MVGLSVDAGWSCDETSQVHGFHSQGNLTTIVFQAGVPLLDLAKVSAFKLILD